MTCRHEHTQDFATCLVCRDCGAKGWIHPGLMRAMTTGKQIDGPIFRWEPDPAVVIILENKK